MIAALIAAAGRGSRLGGEVPKQFLPVLGRPLLWHTLQPFLLLPEVEQVVVILPPGQTDLGRWGLGDEGGRVQSVAGGAERQDSVEEGLRALRPEVDVVVVHDGVRPCLSRFLLEAVIEAARRGRGAISALPARDTLKRVRDRGVIETVSREGIWVAQAPQAFPRAMIVEAYRRAAGEGARGTDDAALCERAGFPVEIVAGEPENIKVTDAGDLRLVEWILQRGRAGGSAPPAG